MLKLREGPKMREFALAMETTTQDVLEWANNMINDPTDAYKSDYPTEELRRDAIQGYMTWVIGYDQAIGITDRIKASLAKERECAGNLTAPI
jgi:hypothetical protein